MDDMDGLDEMKEKPGFFAQARLLAVQYRMSFGLVALGGVLGLCVGMVYLTVVDKTETLAFCAHSCHEMEAGPYTEYTHTPHFANAQGVVVTCADCHVPKGNWFAVFLRKVRASGEIYAHIVGRNYIPANYDPKRPKLQQAVFDEFKANNAAPCKTCHKWDHMILSEQRVPARIMHGIAMKKDENCLDCHKNAGHMAEAK